MGIYRSFISRVAAALLRARGVSVGPDLIAYGLPRVARTPGSAIELGRHVVLCSACAGNPLGVYHPVILSTLRPGSRIRIGSHSGLSGASICAASLISIGDSCLIGANVTITDYDFHSLNPAGRRYNTNPDDIGCAPVIIEDNVWIGMNAIVLKGVTIGRNSVIAAGSIVSRSIPPDCVAGGNPARIIKPLPQSIKETE